ncbi:CD99 molecule isoform X2 [Notothenia coriiceps]|uniref:CD99 molecule isoform X2 n=1 Tax=Notothenia coriiceps TaxID=8208 RepID=A0A6I9NRE3_9TELE|nr:PREDICTED: CD99 antigen-like isoform X2 [Notothenia coriiceps]
MRLCLRIVSLLFVVTGTLTQDGFDLYDALDNDEVRPTPAKPKEEPKAPEDPKSDGGLDLSDAFGPAEPKPTLKPTPKKPSSGDAGGGDGFDLGDALGPDPNPKPDKPVVNPPPSGGGGGNFDINDLAEAGGGGYKPDEGPGGGGGSDQGYESNDGAEEPQAGSGKIAGIASAIGVALLGAASSYFAYQKKKLCFKIQGGVDPESGKHHSGNQSDPQVFSNLLRTS